MASRSKKRRRVLGASCILAALIIAGSSFAWFTAKDEVTNRLSANADYDVKIVESFAPPANWLPGQEVNKDVYATNTGSIEALVKEEINGRLAITYEVDEAKFSEDCVQLTEEERYAVEAGSFLAYKPSDSAAVVGRQIVTRTLASKEDDQIVPPATDFTPDKEGLYVFRRSITVDAEDLSEAFTYDAYYFVPAVEDDGATADVDESAPAKFYKVSNLVVHQDSHVAESTTTPGEGGDPDVTTWTFKDYMNDGINDDGVLMVASGSFRKVKEDFVDPVDLAYLKLSADEVAKEAAESEYSGMDEGQYLVASYDRGNNTAMADAEAKAVAYDKAIHEFEYASQLFAQAQDEYTTADTELQTATTTLNTAITNLENAHTQYDEALKNYNNKLQAYNNALAVLKDAKATYEASMTKLYGKVNGGTSDFTADSLYGKYDAAKTARTDALIPDTYAYTANKGIEEEFDAYKAANNTVTEDVYTELDTAGLKAFRDWVDANTDSEEHDHWMLVIDELIAETNYKNEKDKCLGAADANTTYNNAAAGTYGAAYKTALTNYKTAYAALGDKDKNDDFDVYKDGTVIKDTDKLTADAAAKLALNEAKANLEAKQTAYETALAEYLAAVKKANAAEELKDIAEALKEAATQAQTAAQAAYDAAKVRDAISVSDGIIKIFIKLNDDAVITNQTEATNKTWYLDDKSVNLGDPGDVQTGTLLNNTAVFYYNGLLEGGKTSSKLVDYVLLDSHITKDAYTKFEFDIDVNLDSVQVNYDEDGNFLTDAAQAVLGKFATYNGGTATKDTDKVVIWSDSLT